MVNQVSLLRLNVLRSLYLINVVAVVGSVVWVSFTGGQEAWVAIPGREVIFGAALAAVSLLGIRYPLAMLPVIFMQLFYKAFSVLAVYLPLQEAGPSTDVTLGTLMGIAFYVIVIPWPYVIANYIKKPADRWRGKTASA